MSKIAEDIFLVSMSVLYLSMGLCIMYLLIRKIIQDKNNDEKGGEQ